MITPSPASPSPHARGVFRQPHAINGTIVLHVYRCDGHLMEVAQIHPDWHAEEMEAELEASLDRHCPIHDTAAHMATCPVHRDRLRLL